MFKKVPIGLAVLISTASGVSLSHRHHHKHNQRSIPACNSADFPKCLKAETAADQKLQADMDKHDKDYFVPNFGVDHDIITTQNNFKKAGGKLAQKQSIPACNSADFPKCLKAETAAEQKLQADMDKHDKDYFIPNFGVDHDIITTQNNFKKAGGKLAQQSLMQKGSIPACNSADFPKCLKAETAADQKLQADMDKHDKDYFVPNFGVDHDIITTQNNFKKAGGKLAQKQSIPACNSADFPKCLKAETAADQKLQADMDKHDKDYFVPNFGVDHDIITTQNNFKKAGGKLAQKQSIPACNSADFPKCLKAETAADQKLQADMDKHDKDYFVPNFGVDHDIITTQNNFKKAGGKLAQKASIPACNSADFPKCLKAETAADQKLQADMDKHDKDYFVPNFGVDHDIITTQNNFKKAGGKLAQKQSIPACNSADFPKCLKAETAADQKLQADMDKHDKDYFVPNFGVDHDIITTQNNFKKAGGKLAQKSSIPACNSADFPKCLKAETAADQKLQADMDKHDKDYFVPNFGVDHDIITTQNNFKKAGGKLAQLEKSSIPACNSADFPKCLKAETAAEQKLQADMDKHDKDYFVPNFGVDHDIITTQNNFKKAGGKLAQRSLAQRNSVPACNSTGCKTETAIPKKQREGWGYKTDDQERPNLNESLTGASGVTPPMHTLAQKKKQVNSDPHCNSYECPLRKSMGREYHAFYDHEDTFHRAEEPPKVVEHVHPLDAPYQAAAAKPSNQEKLALYVQEGSIPSCNSHTFPGCVENAITASPWKEGRDQFPVPESTNNGDKVWQKIVADEEKAKEKAEKAKDKAKEAKEGKSDKAAAPQEGESKEEAKKPEKALEKKEAKGEAKEEKKAPAKEEKKAAAKEKKPAAKEEKKAAKKAPAADQEEAKAAAPAKKAKKPAAKKPAAAEKKAQVDADSDQNIQLKTSSDPICNSAGCTQYLHPERETHPMNYPVPDFGMDHEIKASMGHMNALEKEMLGKDEGLDSSQKEVLKATAKATKAPAKEEVKEEKAEAADDKTELQLESKVQMKSAVKAKQALKQKQAKSFKKLKEQMMSNWGTK